LINLETLSASSGVQAASSALCGSEGPCSDRVKLPSAATISFSIQRRTSGGAERNCSKENVKLVIADTYRSRSKKTQDSAQAKSRP
jgi:hypothetical protein